MFLFLYIKFPKPIGVTGCINHSGRTGYDVNFPRALLPILKDASGDVFFDMRSQLAYFGKHQVSENKITLSNGVCFRNNYFPFPFLKNPAGSEKPCRVCRSRSALFRACDRHGCEKPEAALGKAPCRHGAVLKNPRWEITCLPFCNQPHTPFRAGYGDRFPRYTAAGNECWSRRCGVRTFPFWNKPK